MKWFGDKRLIHTHTQKHTELVAIPDRSSGRSFTRARWMRDTKSTGRYTAECTPSAHTAQNRIPPKIGTRVSGEA